MSNIKNARLAKEIKQADAAKQLRISLKSLYNYEHGGAVPSDVLIKMSELYKCPSDYLLGITDYNSITVVKKHCDCLEPVAVINKDGVIEHCDYSVILSIN